jgi:DNA-binding NarL/FixJ family response regulator
MPATLRIGLLDSDSDVRSGRKMTLSSRSDFEIVFESQGQAEDLESIAQSLIDVLVIDQKLGLGPGVEFYSRLRALTGAKQAPAAVLTCSYTQDTLTAEALEQGIQAIVSLELGLGALADEVALAPSGKHKESVLDLHQLLSRVSLKPQLDLDFMRLVSELPEKLSSNLRRFHSVWQKGDSSKLADYEISSLDALVARLPVRTTSELVIRLHRSGLLDVK